MRSRAHEQIAGGLPFFTCGTALQFLPCWPLPHHCADQGKGYITEEDVARVADAHEFAWDVNYLAEMVHLFSEVCTSAHASAHAVLFWL